MRMDFVDEFTEEFDEIFVFEVDAEEEAVEEGHGVLFDVVGVFDDALNDFVVKWFFAIRISDFLAKTISFFESVSDFVMEINFFSEDVHVVVDNLVVVIFVFFCTEVF